MSKPAAGPAPAQRKFLLLNGTHVERGVRYKFTPGKDTYVLSTEDLSLHYPDRFEEVEADAPPAPARVAKPKPETETERVNAKRNAKKVLTPEQLGKEFTEEHPEAEEKGLRVFHRDGKFVVTKEDDPSTVVHPEQPKGFHKKAALEKFIDDYE